MQLEKLLDRKTAARYLGVSPGTMAVWDCTKKYDLNPLKVGRSVRYRKADLDKFIERLLVKPARSTSFVSKAKALPKPIHHSISGKTIHENYTTIVTYSNSEIPQHPSGKSKQ